MFLRPTLSSPASSASASPQHRRCNHLQRSISANSGRAPFSIPATRSEKRAFKTELPSCREKMTPCWMPLQNGGIYVGLKRASPCPSYLLDELKFPPQQCLKAQGQLGFWISS